MSADRAKLYICRTPEGLCVSLLVKPMAVNYDIPAEADIDMAVIGLKGGRVRGLLGMRAEDMKEWLREDKREKDIERRRWELVVRLLQGMFRDGTVPKEISWATMVLTLKGKKEYQGIGIVEVFVEGVHSSSEFLLKRSVMLHDTLHGFIEGRGTGTDNLEAKLVQQLESIAHEPLFQVFLDVRKEYDLLDRGWCL